MWIDCGQRFFVGLNFRESTAIGVAKLRVESIGQHYDGFASLALFLQFFERIFQSLVEIGFAGARSNVDRIIGFLTIHAETTQRLYVLVELNNSYSILRRKRVEKTLAREFQLLPKIQGRAGHVEHQHQTERRVDRLEMLDRLLHS